MLLTAFCASLLPSLPAQAAWLRDEGAFFTSQTVDIFKSRHFHHPDGEKEKNAPIPVYNKQEYTTYLEYGWHKNITIGGKVSLTHVESLEPNYGAASGFIRHAEHNWGITQPELFLRTPITSFSTGSFNWILSAQPKIKLPSLFLEGGTPRSDTDDIDGEMRFLMGINGTIKNKPHFLVLEGAYRHRTGELHDQWLYDATLGIDITPRLTALSQLFLVRSNDLPKTSPTMDFYLQDYESDKAQMSLVYRLTKDVRFQAGGYMHLSPRNTGAGKGAIFSIWREF